MDQNLQILLYFGGLVLLGTLATVAALVMANRERANKNRHKRLRQRPEEASPAPARQAQVQLVWAGEDMPLIWQVEGEPYANPDRISNPEHRAVVEQFIQKLGQTLPALLAPRPVPAPSAPRPESTEATFPLGAPVEPVAEPEPLPTPPVQEAVEPLEERGEEEELSTLESMETMEAGPGEPVTELAEPTPSFIETPVAPPSQRPTPARPRTYEEMMELPFLERLKASFFGPPAPTAANRLDQAERQPLPTMPKVDDLNTILQQRLALYPDVPSASIRPTPQGLLEIIVDGKIYERIEDVPHDKVRETMRDAVRIWEKGLR